MNSSRSTSLVAAARLISILLFLVFVVPQAPAQQDKKPAPAPAKEPRVQGNSRPISSQRPPTTGVAQKTDNGAEGQRGRSTRADGKQGATSNAEKELPSGEGRPGRTGNPRSGRSSKPETSRDPRTTDSHQPTPARNSRRNAGAEHLPSPAGAPGRSADPTGPAEDRGSLTNRPGRRGSSNNAASPSGETRSGGEKNASDNARPNNTKGRFSRTTRPSGTIVEHDKNGRTTSVTTPRGTTARMDGRGRVTSIRDKGGNTISRGPRGERRVETVRADRSRVVSLGSRTGYVERRFDRGGRQYMRRTYVVGGRTYVHVYRGHYYHGVPYYVYVPPYYYAPAYYGWIYNPWPRPVYYRWGWYGSRWYRPYSYYFAPYPVYPYPSLWLTDYLLAENLRLAYEAGDAESYRGGDSQAEVVLAAYPTGNQRTGDEPNVDSVVLTPELKQMIADEVKSVIVEQEKAARSLSGSSQTNLADEPPPALDPNHRVFVAFSVLEVAANDETCSLTSGDVIKRTQDTPDSNNTVSVQILASKRSDCAIGSGARMQITDLNDMQNHLREQVYAGMKTLSEKQGKDGLPAAPPANFRAVPEGTAAPDPTAAEDLHKQEQEADQTEREIQQEASPDSGSDN
jgi:YD repeat-containing protein